LLSCCDELSTQNWSGQGELFKAKGSYIQLRNKQTLKTIKIR
jgi:hypothetical protein